MLFFSILADSVLLQLDILFIFIISLEVITKMPEASKKKKLRQLLRSIYCFSQKKKQQNYFGLN